MNCDRCDSEDVWFLYGHKGGTVQSYCGPCVLRVAVAYLGACFWWVFSVHQNRRRWRRLVCRVFGHKFYPMSSVYYYVDCTDTCRRCGKIEGQL